MIPAALYQPIYLLAVTLMTLFSMSLYGRWGKLLKSSNTSQIISIFMLVMVVVFVGTRPVSDAYFIDMAGYSATYEYLLNEAFSFNWKVDNLIWDNFYVWMASRGISFSTWLILVASAYFGLMYLACRKLFGNDVLIAFVTYLGAFSTFSYGTNGMKAGVAASVFLVAMAYRDKLWLSIPIALLSYGFHHSMIMVIAAYFVVLLLKNPKYYFVLWIISLIIAALGITYFQTYFAGFTTEHGAEYLLATEDTTEAHIGFRPDFILYSVVPLILGYNILYRYKFRSVTYSFLLRLYIMTNTLWMLCMYASFNNRIAYLSWFIYPIVLIYPFISREKNLFHGKYLRWVVYGHLGFTLFMNFVYLL